MFIDKAGIYTPAFFRPTFFETQKNGTIFTRPVIKIGTFQIKITEYNFKENESVKIMTYHQI